MKNILLTTAIVALMAGPVHGSEQMETRLKVDLNALDAYLNKVKGEGTQKRIVQATKDLNMFLDKNDKKGKIPWKKKLEGAALNLASREVIGDVGQRDLADIENKMVKKTPVGSYEADYFAACVRAGLTSQERIAEIRKALSAPLSPMPGAKAQPKEESNPAATDPAKVKEYLKAMEPTKSPGKRDARTVGPKAAQMLKENKDPSRMGGKNPASVDPAAVKKHLDSFEQ